MVQIVNLNTFTNAKWIVSTSASDGTHTTITSAIASASSGDTIFIRPGTYSGNFTLTPGVNLASIPDGNPAPFTKIQGTITFSGAGTSSISGLNVSPSSGACVQVTGSAASILNINNCTFEGVNGTAAIILSSSSSSAILNIFNSSQRTGNTLFAFSSNGTANMYNCGMADSNAQTTSTFSNVAVNIYDSSFNTRITVTGGTVVSSYNCTFTSIPAGGQVITSGTWNAFNCYLQGGTSTAVTVTSPSVLYAYNCVIDSSASNPLNGTGTINFANVAYLRTQNTNNVTTKTLYLVDGENYKGISNNTSPATTCIGQTQRAVILKASATTLTNNTPKTVQSVACQAGIWDVSGVISFTGLTTGTFQQASLSTVTNTLGTAGDNMVGAAFTSSTAGDISLIVPSYRINVASGSSQTMFLVANCVFSAGTVKAYGRISARRVA